MDAQTAIEGMIKKSGLTPAELSKALGKSRTYVYSLRSQGSIPSLDTFARLAHECGYKVMLETKDGSRSVELYSGVDVSSEIAAWFNQACRDSSGEEAPIPYYSASDHYATTNEEADSMRNAELAHEERMKSDPEYRAAYAERNAKYHAEGRVFEAWYYDWADEWRKRQREKEMRFFDDEPKDSSDSKPE